MLVDRINGAARRLPTWPIYVVGLAAAAWPFWLGLTDRFGPEPINTLERIYGERALQLLVAGLAITPLRRVAGVNLIRFRRSIGLTAFFFVCVHLAVWSLLDLASLEAIGTEIFKRPYITVGFLAFLLLIPLAVTSNDRSVRALGPRWRQLHKLTYAAVILGGIHYVWLAKGFQIEPLVYVGLVVGLLAARLRVQPARRVRRA